MNDLNRFASNPVSLDISRSRFERNQEVHTSFNISQIIPFYIDEVLPGDTFQVSTNKVVRLSTLLTPVMDNIYLDTYYFFVPNRLIWSHWVNFMGETDQAWSPSTTYTTPKINSPSGGWSIGTIADYLGIPTGVDLSNINALPFRAYAKICDDWFRDENLSDPLVIPLDETTQTGVNTGTFVTDVANGGLPYTARKLRDYFTSALPSPQKGAAVTIGGTSINPVLTSPDAFPLTSLGDYAMGLDYFASGQSDWTRAANNQRGYTPLGAGRVDASSTSTPDVNVAPHMPGTMSLAHISDETKQAKGSSEVFRPNNLYTEGFNLSINALRLAFQTQKLLERNARGGTRYIELLRSHFGVTSPDARLQRSEYLGGNRIPFTVNQVVQNSSTASTPQGTTTAYSHTVDTNNDFTKSFVEHGFVIGVAIARYHHSYQQGLHKMFSRDNYLDYYFPVFANIGELPIKNKEIYADGSSNDDKVFGYQEAWAEYRYLPNKITGQMRSAATASYDLWHFADDYNSLPTLSDSWIREDPTNVDRALAIKSSSANQVLADFYIENISTRAMPLYSIPGLIDHH